MAGEVVRDTRVTSVVRLERVACGWDGGVKRWQRGEDGKGGKSGWGDQGGKVGRERVLKVAKVAGRKMQ